MVKLVQLIYLLVKNVLMKIKLNKESNIFKKELIVIEKEKEVNLIINLHFYLIDLLWLIIKKVIIK